MQIDLETVIVGAVNYRNGAMRTGIAVDSARATATARGDSVRVTTDLTRQGNAAYLGHMALELVALDGRVLGTSEEDLAVYRSLRKVETLAVPPGVSLKGATVRYRFTGERPDIDPDARLSSEAVTGAITLGRGPGGRPRASRTRPGRRSPSRSASDRRSTRRPFRRDTSRASSSCA